nr:CoA ester lyase [uncultured Brevundimonas sp.]
MSKTSDLVPVAEAASFLFVPGDRPERFGKAEASGSGQVIIDLEDAVAADMKDIARDCAAKWFETGRRGVVRINAADTPWHEADVASCIAPSLDAIMAPKAEHPERLAAIAHRTGKPIIALIETAAGLNAANAIAATPGVVRLAFGSIDLSLDLGLDAPDEALDGFRLRLTLASRLADLAPPIDGVLADFRNATRLTEITRRVRGLGFSAKLCIHPVQVTWVEQGFAPSSEELAWAQRVVGLGESVAALDGEMIDRPVRERALRLLARIRRSTP